MVACRGVLSMEEDLVRDDIAVSVVTSVFNGERYLAEAIESILNQTFEDFEFILIDDGSTDSTSAILEQYEKRDPRIQVLRQANLGLIEALNRGCRIAKGKYIARMDADDVAVSGRLKLQLEFLERNPEVGVLGGGVEFISVQGSPLGRSFNPRGDAAIRSALAHCSPFWHPTVMMQKEAFRNAGGYRRAFVQAEDYDLWLRIAERYQLANLDAVLLQYRLHPHQVSVQHRSMQVISSMAARASADARAKGNADPLESADKITETLLQDLGIDKHAQERELINNYVWTIRNMCDTGEYRAASEILDRMQLHEVREQCGTRTASDLHLLAARIYWHEKRLRKASVNFVKAVGLRPSVICRPLGKLTIPRQIQAR